MNHITATLLVFVGLFLLPGCSRTPLYNYAASADLCSSSRGQRRLNDINQISCYYRVGQTGLNPIINYKEKAPKIVITDSNKIRSFMAALMQGGEMPAGMRISRPGGIVIVLFFKSDPTPAYFHCYLWPDRVMMTPLLDGDVATGSAYSFYKYIKTTFPELTD